MALVLILFAALVCLRMPEIVIKGRFWAEEGRYFYHDAWVMPPLQALLAPVGGYLNIVANASTLAARWLLPLRLAPYLTIAAALAVQLCPPLLWLSARDEWLRPPRVRLAGVLLLLFVPASEEIWLQTLHCQFELTLCCAMILALEIERGTAAWLRLGLLFLAPLCGPGAIALVPLFFLRAIVDFSIARFGQAMVLAAGAALQLAFFFQAVPGRGYALHPRLLMAVIAVHHLALPFGGVPLAGTTAAWIRGQLATGHMPIVIIVLPALVFLPFLVATLLRRRSMAAFWLLFAGLLLAATSYFGAIGGLAGLLEPHLGERYSFVPQALFGLAALVLAATASKRVAAFCWAVVAWLVVLGAYGYFQPWSFVADGPSWRPQVAQWQADPAHPLLIWPKGWTMTLEAQRTAH